MDTRIDMPPVSSHERKGIRLSSYFFALYLLLLPISTALAGIIGKTSLLNYIVAIYFTLAFFETLILRVLRMKKSLRFIYYYYLYTLASLLWGISSPSTWMLTTFLTSVLVFSIASVSCYSDKEKRLFLRAIYLSAFVAIAAAIWTILYHRSYRLYVTITSTMDPNDFGCGLGIITSLYLLTAMETRRKISSILVLVCVAVMIVLTGSRGALLMFIGILAVYFFLFMRGSKITNYMLVILALLFFLIMFSDSLPTYLQDRLQLSSVIQDGGAGRMAIWKAALIKYSQSNFFRMLFGYGYGGFRQSVRYYSGRMNTFYQAHSMYVNELIEGGFVGMTLLLSAFFQAFCYAWREKNYLGYLSLLGFLIEGITLDSQNYRIFGVAFTAAVIFHERDVQKSVRRPRYFDSRTYL